VVQRQIQRLIFASQQRIMYRTSHEFSTLKKL